MGATFWSDVRGITRLNERSKETQWMSFAELRTKYGDEADSMAAVLPKKPHPKNPRVFLWCVEDDKGKMSVSSWQKAQVSGSVKLDKTAAQAARPQCVFNART